jgi:heme exporter protein C
MHRFANPTRFFRLANAAMPVLAVACVGLFASGLYFALLDSPADYQQGETVRIMYVHVPAAWMAMACYATMALAGASFLIWKHILADLAARAAAPIGACFTLIALVTGSLWGQPMWGTWWVWDARLTSVLILLFLYLGYIALVNAFDDPDRGGRVGAVLALVGAANLPIIKFSVDWWNTLHQPASVMRMDGPSIAPEMLLPLMLMAGAYGALFGLLMVLRLRALYAGRRLRQLRLAAAAEAPGHHEPA